MAEQVPSVGRIVHVVLEHGEHRPAIIVKVWSDDQHACTPQTACNLRVFLDQFDRGPEFMASVVQGNGPGSWHWPE